MLSNTNIILVLFFLQKLVILLFLYLGILINDWREDMKKLLVSLFILLLMVGCGNNKTLKCSSSRSGNNMRGSTNYDIEYQNKDVKFVTITYDYTQDGDVVNNTTTTDVTDSTGNTVILPEMEFATDLNSNNLCADQGDLLRMAHLLVQ